MHTAAEDREKPVPNNGDVPLPKNGELRGGSGVEHKMSTRPALGLEGVWLAQVWEHRPPHGGRVSHPSDRLPSAARRGWPHTFQEDPFCFAAFQEDAIERTVTNGAAEKQKSFCRRKRASVWT